VKNVENFLGCKLTASESPPMLPGSLPNPKLGLLTTAEDVAATADVKHLAQGLDAIRERFSLQRPIHETLAQRG